MARKVLKVTTIRLPKWLKDRVKVEAQQAKPRIMPSKFWREVIEEAVKEWDIKKVLKGELFKAIEDNKKGASQSIGLSKALPFKENTKYVIAIMCYFLEINGEEYNKLSKKDNKVAQKIQNLKTS